MVVDEGEVGDEGLTDALASNGPSSGCGSSRANLPKARKRARAEK